MTDRLKTVPRNRRSRCSRGIYTAGYYEPQSSVREYGKTSWRNYRQNFPSSVSAALASRYEGRRYVCMYLGSNGGGKYDDNKLTLIPASRKMIRRRCLFVPVNHYRTPLYFRYTSDVVVGAIGTKLCFVFERCLSLSNKRKRDRTTANQSGQ